MCRSAGVLTGSVRSLSTSLLPGFTRKWAGGNSRASYGGFMRTGGARASAGARRFMSSNSKKVPKHETEKAVEVSKPIKQDDGSLLFYVKRDEKVSPWLL